MSEMVERVARAMAVADGKDPDAPAWAVTRGGRTYPEGICWRDQYARKARAAIEAMRELPDELADIGRSNNFGNYPNAAWEAMISAALSPEEEGIGR